MKKQTFKHKLKVIPKEEIIANRSNAYEFIDFDKQETPEEALYKIRLKEEYWIDEVAFELGAKWKEKRSYSKEEVIGFGEFCLKIKFEPIEDISVEKLLEIYKK